MRRPLDYASANDEGGSKVAWAVVIAFVCLPIIAFGLLMLWYGVTGAIEMYRKRPPRADLPTDLFQIVMMLIIGLFCESACARWIWVAYRKGK